MTNALSLLLAACAALAWLTPTPGQRGLAAGSALLVVLAWSNRLGERHRERLHAAVAVGLIASAREADAWSLAAGAAGILTLAAAGGRAGLVSLVVGGVCVLGSGRLAPAAMLTGLVALKAGRAQPRASILAAAAVVGVASTIASTMVGRDASPAPLTARDIHRGAFAEVLDASNPRVVAKTIVGSVLGSSGARGAGLRASAEELMRRGGYDATSAAIRIMTCAPADVRAHVAEALLRAPAALDSLEAWGDRAVPWRHLASSLYRNRPPVHLLRWPSWAAVAGDSLTAEYAARLLLDIGVEAAACTLASLPQWRETGWARFIVWKANHEWEAPVSWAAVGRSPEPVPRGAWLLTRGQPARGVWPRLRVWDHGAEQVMEVRSEACAVVARRTEGAGHAVLINDLRAPGEDRNVEIAPLAGFDESWFLDAVVSPEGFWLRTTSRVRTWREGRDDHALMPECVAGLVEAAPGSWQGAVRAESGWELTGPGRIVWRGLPGGEKLLVMRGQQAHGRWPIVELAWPRGITRRAVDSRQWTCEPLTLSCGDSLSLRFVNDFWDPETGQDRNLWVAGLFVGHIQARAYVER